MYPASVLLFTLVDDITAVDIDNSVSCTDASTPILSVLYLALALNTYKV